jgi:hypothetical protein
MLPSINVKSIKRFLGIVKCLKWILQKLNWQGHHFLIVIYPDRYLKTPNLKKADLRTAYNYHIDPESNKLKKAKFSLQGLPGLLDKYGIDIE